MPTSYNQTLKLGSAVNTIQPTLLPHQFYGVEYTAKDRENYRQTGKEDNVNFFVVAALSEQDAIDQINSWYAEWSQSGIPDGYYVIKSELLYKNIQVQFCGILSYAHRW